MNEKEPIKHRPIESKWTQELGLGTVGFSVLADRIGIVRQINGNADALFRESVDPIFSVALPQSNTQIPMERLVDYMAKRFLADHGARTSSHQALKYVGAYIGEIIPVGNANNDIKTLTLGVENNTERFARPHAVFVITDQSISPFELKTTEPISSNGSTRQDITIRVSDVAPGERVRYILLLECDNTDVTPRDRQATHNPTKTDDFTFDRYFFYSVRQPIPSDKRSIQSWILDKQRKEQSLNSMQYWGTRLAIVLRTAMARKSK